MLIAVMAGLIALFFVVMKNYSAPTIDKEQLAIYKQQIANAPKKQIRLEGTLTRVEFYYYLDVAKKTRVPVISQQIDLSSFIDQKVVVQVEDAGNQLNIVKIEELATE